VSGYCDDNNSRTIVTELNCIVEQIKKDLLHAELV
jgi:hypothetical protein